MRREFSVIIKYAGLWGIAEASLGYLLHILNSFTPLKSLAGMVMFPIGLYFMLLTYRETGRERSIILLGFLTGLIKLVNLGFPYLPPGATLNPAVSIVLESSLVFAGIVGFKRIKPFIHLPLLSILWRTSFVLFLMVSPVSKGILQRGWVSVACFLTIEAITSGLLAGIVHRLFTSERLRGINIKPLLSPIVFVFALIFEVLTKI